MDKKNVIIIFLLFLFIILIFIKNYILCDFYSDCSLTQEEYGGDLSKYSIRYGADKISFQDPKWILINVVFYFFNFLVSFEIFLLIFQFTFYSVLFFVGLKFTENMSIMIFVFFLLLVISYPIYNGYSSFVLRQGLGIIFFISGIFLVEKKIFRFLFIILASFSHFVFLFVYLIFFVSRFFSVKFLTLIFLLSIFNYITGNDFFFKQSVYLLNIFDNPIIPSNKLNKVTSEINFHYALFSILPISLIIIPSKNNKLLKNLYRFHLLYSSIVYLFLSKFYYLDRFISLSWIFYPFYFSFLLNMCKLNFKNIKRNFNNN